MPNKISVPIFGEDPLTVGAFFSDKKVAIWIPMQIAAHKRLKFHSFSKNVLFKCVSVQKMLGNSLNRHLFFYRGILRKLYFNLNNIEPTSTKSLADLQVFVSVRSL